MKYVLLNAPNKIEIIEKEIPEVKDDSVLVKIEHCGFCGTDFQIYSGRFPVAFPYSPGHEYAGKIEELGSSVKRLSKGDRVAVDPNYHCGVCNYCRKGETNFCENRKLKVKSNGGFAEYSAVPSQLVYKIPDNLSSEDAVFAETVSCCLHALDKAGIKYGEKVLILGGGAVGLIMLQLIRGTACAVFLSEPVGLKRNIAEEFGADRAIDPASEDVVSIVKDKTADYGLDKVIDCSGSIDAVKKCMGLLRKGGALVLTAIYPESAEITFSPMEILKNEITIKGAFLNPFTFHRSIDVLSQNKINVRRLITHRFALNEIKKAYETFSKNEGIKILITP